MGGRRGLLAESGNFASVLPLCHLYGQAASRSGTKIVLPDTRAGGSGVAPGSPPLTL